MESIFTIRAHIINFFKKYEDFISPVLKFIAAFIVFSQINSMGYATMISNTPVTLLAAFLSAVLTPLWMFFLMTCFITFHIFYASIELSIIVCLILLLMLLFYIRLFPKQSLVIVALLIFYKLNIPYVIPLFTGLFIGLSACVPLIMGTFLWHFLPNLESLIKISPYAEFNAFASPEKLIEIYVAIVNILTLDNTWIFIGIVYALTAIIIHLISLMPINYSKEIALGSGIFIMIVGFVMAVSVSGAKISIGSAILLTLLSGLLAELCNFFYVTLDYGKSQRVQFQDEDYYYYVKLVPKIKMAKK